jgi:hypothetical protein
MADLLDQTLNEIRARINELRPLVSEYERLQAAERALGTTARTTHGSRPGATRRRSSSVSRAPRGANKRKVYAAVGERPGATAAELSAASGVTKPLIYNITRDGVGRGELERQQLPSGAIGFKLATSGEAAA